VNVWNSPRSPQGSIPGGSSARSRSRLGFNQFPLHAVHGNAIRLFVERGQESNNFNIGSLAKDIKTSSAFP
jgi:hypothetical protein